MREKIKQEFREFLNEGRVKKARAYGKELAKKTADKDSYKEYSSSKSTAIKVKIDRKFKFNLPKNLIDDRDIISTDIENSQTKGIKANKLDGEYEIFGKKFIYLVPEDYIELI